MNIFIFIFCFSSCLLYNLPVFGESTSGTLPHATDFLTLPKGPGGTTWYLTANSADRARARQELINRRYTHLYLSVASGRHNYYGDPTGFRVFLKELINDGIKPVVWLTSDTGKWKDQSVKAIKSSLASFVPQIDDLVNSYCMGIEIDEYWSESKAEEIGNYLDSLTDRPIAVHQLPGAWGYCKDYCDYMIFQYGFGKTESQIQSMTVNVRKNLGKPVVAGEYHSDRNNEALSIRLGNSAVSAGASGFGNGGTGSEAPRKGEFGKAGRSF
jgi:hypothetical protein